MKGHLKKNEIMKGMAVIVVLILCECFFFRNIIDRTGALIGNRNDGRLTMLLTEHWYNFFRGTEEFDEIAMFYPCKEAIGYTDLLFGYGIIHSLFRFMGFNMYISYKSTLILFHFIGTFSAYYLLRKSLKCSTVWSLFGTISFCFSTTYAVHLRHTQLDALAFLPIMTIIIIGIVNNFTNRFKRNIYIYMLILCFALLTYNSWYVACLTGIFGVVFIIVYAIRLKKSEVRVSSILREIIQVTGRDIAGYLIFGFILFIPFLYIYIPVLSQSNGYSYAECACYMPEVADIINVTEDNFLFGWLVRRLGFETRGYSMEVTEGYSIVLLCVYFLMYREYRKKNSIENNKCIERTDILLNETVGSVFVSVLICLLLVVRLSSNGISLWWFVYTLIPVARSLRAVARFMIWLSFPMSVVSAYYASRCTTIHNTRNKVISYTTLILLFVSNITVTGVSSYWSIPEETEFISNVTIPPHEVESFYVIDSAESEDTPNYYQLDAFEIANNYGLKTINGYSGQFPPEWWGIWDVQSNAYESCIYDWVEKNDLEDVYAYDIANGNWYGFEERKSKVTDKVFYPADNRFSLCRGLKDYTQGDFVWTGMEPEVVIENEKIKESGLMIKYRTELSYYLKQNPRINPCIELYVDGEWISNIEVKDGYGELTIPMDDHVGDKYTVSFNSNCLFNPRTLGINEDSRDLSIGLYYIGD